MFDVEFRVSKAGSKRAKREQQRNVHAYMVADNFVGKRTLKSFRLDQKDLNRMVKVTYNPYKYDTFVNADTEEPITKADYAIAHNGRVYVKCSGS